MKSLSISTATFAVAISLATSAHANETAPVALPDIDENVQTIEFEDVLEVPAIDLAAPAGDSLGSNALEGIDLGAFGVEPTDGLLRLPPMNSSDANLGLTDQVVTTRNLKPLYGDIGAFYGDIVAFYGDIDAFWGDINPFYGDINAFWGDISPFYGDINAFWGDISPFWGDIVAFSETNLAAIGNFWQTNGALISETDALWAKSSFSSVATRLNTMKANAIAQFGGRGFNQTIANQVMARHGINPADLTTLQNKTAAQRAAFFIDWHDTVNNYTGIDHVDHWMNTVNWSPSITQIQGAGHQTIIGIIDGSFASNDANLDTIIAWKGGGTTTVSGHGAGVASLIAGAHDGQGVMGIAPQAKLATYNPFGVNQRASWDDVANGINALLYAYVGGNQTGYVSIINLSLGESGWALSQGLADVFARPDISSWSHETIYVVAAGNDGISQTANINWNFAKDTSFILVGSVDPNGQISSFSNRPGSACLLNNGVCYSGNELYKRTVVAPGSLLLMSDGQGGVTRQSGTSFAAPLVSGAVALLHDRWPWLVSNPNETAEIIFRSAKDLGAPGPDPVYGWGLLDVTASQSPLDFGKLNFKLYQKKGTTWRASTKTATEILTFGIPSWWTTEGVNLTGLETIGGTYRDFMIPLSAAQYGESSDSLGHGYQRMQDFVGDRFARWLVSKGLDKNGDGKLGLNQVQSNTEESRGQWTMRYDAISPRFGEDDAVKMIHNAATLTTPTGNISFTVGHGQGALALAGNNFGIVSDHDQETGGVNPVLGFASGEFFAGASYSPAKATTLSFGYSKNREDWRDLEGASEIDQNIQRALGARDAGALTFGIEQKVSKNLTVNAQYTHLRENNALLGAQTTVEDFLGEGSATDAVTVSASMNLGNGFSFDLSATGGATKTADGQLLASRGRVMSTAGQFTLNKRGLMGDGDILRVSVGQPLTVEAGELELVSEQVIDRQTGELGVVSQTIGLQTKRRYTGELVYATPVGENSELGVIARYVSEGEVGQEESVMIGANFGWRF